MIQNDIIPICEQYLEATGENSGDAAQEENSQQKNAETDLLAGQSDDGVHNDVEMQSPTRTQAQYIPHSC